MKTEYTIVSKEYKYDLQNRVIELIKKGWKPLGGVSVAMSESSISILKKEYCQAMIREDS